MTPYEQGQVSVVLKNNWRLISALERVGDNLLIVVCFLASYQLRDTAVAFLAPILPKQLAPEQMPLAPLSDYLVILGIALPLFNAFLSMLGAYRSMRFSRFFKVVRNCLFASALVFLCVGSMLYLLKLDLSRSFVASFCLLCGLALMLERLGVLLILRYFRLRGKNFRNLLIVGTGEQARRLSVQIAADQELGVRVVGFVSMSEEVAAAVDPSLNAIAHTNGSSPSDAGLRVVADAGGYESALKRFAVDEVMFTDVSAHFPEVQEMARIASEEGVRVTLAADLFSAEIFRSEMSYFGDTALIHYHPSPAAGNALALTLKRVIDVIISASLLVLLFPLMLIIAVAVVTSSRGPVFFRQRRVGLNGRRFTLLKFRSMVNGAQRMRGGLLEQNEMSGPVFKIRQDPRITPVGRFLRRYSLDELPQLWNVLKGDMSLVGPRPPLPGEVTSYRREQRKRLSMRPGLTCIWQVSGRNEIPDFEKWAELDLQYIDNWSLWSDLKLMLQTIPTVIAGTGR